MQYAILLNNSLLRSLNQNLDTPGVLNIIKSLLGILEADTTSDQLLDADLALGQEPDGQLVITRSVSEAALDIELLGTHLTDRERDVTLAHAALHVHATGAQRMDAGLDARLGARRVDGHVCANAQVALLDQARGAVLGALALRAEDVCGGVLVRELQALFVDVDGDDLVGAEGAGNGAAEKTDGSSAEDDDALARLDVGLCAGDVNTDGEGLDECACELSASGDRRHYKDIGDSPSSRETFSGSL